MFRVQKAISAFICWRQCNIILGETGNVNTLYDFQWTLCLSDGSIFLYEQDGKPPGGSIISKGLRVLKQSIDGVLVTSR